MLVYAGWVPAPPLVGAVLPLTVNVALVLWALEWCVLGVLVRGMCRDLVGGLPFVTHVGSSL